MLRNTPRRRSQAAPTAQQRDRRLFSATQARLDNVKDIKFAVEQEAERHWQIARARLAEADELAVVELQLTVALARIEGRLVQGKGSANLREAAE